MVDVPSSDFCDFANALNEVKLKKGRKVDSTGWDYGINLSDGKNDYRLSFVFGGKYRYRFKDIWNKRTVRSVKLYNSCEHYFKNKK